MIQLGKRSCFIIDKKGFLPAHVACSRHCSPEKLDMLLQVNPNSLFTITNSGDTLLSLAIKTATKSHPNYALINDIRRRLDKSTTTSMSSSGFHPYDVHSSLVISTFSSDKGNESIEPEEFDSSFGTTSDSDLFSCRKRKVTADDQDNYSTIKQEESEQANLLLHFSRHMDEDVGETIAHV